MLSIDDYKENGVAWPFRLSTDFKNFDLEKEYFKFQDQAIKKFGKKVSVKPNLLSSFFDRMAFDGEILEKVKSVIGPNVYIWSSAFFAKAPGDGKIVSYHQDNPYWQLTSNNVVTAWIALTKSDQQSGAMEIVPGSYKLGLIDALDVDNPREAYLKGKKTTSESDLLSYRHNVDDYVTENKPLTITLDPGSFSLHHVNAIHGSGVNASNHHRIGFAVRYVSSETKHKIEKSDSALHVCGIKNPYFEDEVRPTADFDDNAIECYENAMRSAGAFGNKKYG